MAKRLLTVLISLIVVGALVAVGFVIVGAINSAGDRSDVTSGITTEASGLTQEVWDTFVRVVTPDVASQIMSQYRVGDAPKSDTLAYVYQDDDPEHWVLATNLATSEDKPSLIATLVHEYAHILTLTGTEMNRDEHSCATIELSEGCARDDSYLLAFQEQFWAAYGDSAPRPTTATRMSPTTSTSRMRTTS